MANHSSATTREETPHVSNSIKQTISNARKRRDVNNSTKRTISKALRRRAEAVINDRSIDAQSRALIRYGLEINDPRLAELVRRLEAGETIIETIVLLKHPKPTPRIPTRRD